MLLRAVRDDDGYLMLMLAATRYADVAMFDAQRFDARYAV